MRNGVFLASSVIVRELKWRWRNQDVDGESSQIKNKRTFVVHGQKLEFVDHVDEGFCLLFLEEWRKFG